LDKLSLFVLVLKLIKFPRFPPHIIRKAYFSWKPKSEDDKSPLVKPHWFVLQNIEL